MVFEGMSCGDHTGLESPEGYVGCALLSVVSVSSEHKVLNYSLIDQRLDEGGILTRGATLQREPNDSVERVEAAG